MARVRIKILTQALHDIDQIADYQSMFSQNRPGII